MKIWSLRHSIAYGSHWRYERDVMPETADQWLKVFQTDEPEIMFKVSKTKPKI